MGNPNSFDSNGPKPWKGVPFPPCNMIGDWWWRLHRNDQNSQLRSYEFVTLQVHNSCTIFFIKELKREML